MPQGSVLGPLLFLLYINDFWCSARKLDFHLFADDANLFNSHTRLQYLELNLNEQLSNVDVWLSANKLSLNIDKTHFVIFYPPQKKTNYNVILKIRNYQIEEKQSIKYLGIFIDSHLNWKTHILELSKTILRGIGILAKLRHFVSIEMLLQIDYAIIYSFLF